MQDHQRRAIRHILSGQEDEPVTLQTDPGGGETGWVEDHAPHVPADVPSVSHEQLADELRRHDPTVSPDEVLAQLQRHDPLLLELLALRAYMARLQG